MKKRMMLAGCMVLLAVVGLMKFGAMKAAVPYKDYQALKTALTNAADSKAIIDIFDNMGKAGELWQYIGKADSGKNQADFASIFKLEVGKDAQEIQQKMIDQILINADFLGEKDAAIKYLATVFTEPQNSAGALATLLNDNKNTDLLLALLDEEPEIIELPLGGIYGDMNALELALVNQNYYYLEPVGKEKAPSKEVLQKMADIFPHLHKNVKTRTFKVGKYIEEVAFLPLNMDVKMTDLVPSGNGNIKLKVNGIDKRISDIIVLPAITIPSKYPNEVAAITKELKALEKLNAFDDVVAFNAQDKKVQDAIYVLVLKNSKDQVDVDFLDVAKSTAQTVLEDAINKGILNLTNAADAQSFAKIKQSLNALLDQHKKNYYALGGASKDFFDKKEVSVNLKITFIDTSSVDELGKGLSDIAA